MEEGTYWGVYNYSLKVRKESLSFSVFYDEPTSSSGTLKVVIKAPGFRVILRALEELTLNRDEFV